MKNKSSQISPSRRAILAGAIATAAMPLHLHAGTGNTAMHIRCTFADQDFIYLLQNVPTTREFAPMLPQELTIEDFSTNEKLAHLPRRLDEAGWPEIDDR